MKEKNSSYYDNGNRKFPRIALSISVILALIWRSEWKKPCENGGDK